MYNIIINRYNRLTKKKRSLRLNQHLIKNIFLFKLTFLIHLVLEMKENTPNSK